MTDFYYGMTLVGGFAAVVLTAIFTPIWVNVFTCFAATAAVVVAWHYNMKHDFEDRKNYDR